MQLQAKIHPFVCYYRHDMQDKIPEHTSFVIISECNIHECNIQYMILWRFISLTNWDSTLKGFAISLTVALPSIRIGKTSVICASMKMTSVSQLNGTSSPHHTGKDYLMALGTIKRLAARASLQHPYDQQITTPPQLFEFADSEINNVNCQFATTEQYKQ